MTDTPASPHASAEDRPTIDIVSDVVCPWCYIGKRRLEAALASRDEPPPLIRWHPFQLNPYLPAGGIDRRVYLEDKFGGPDGARQVYARVEAVGREVGIPFAFERIRRQPSTVDAHRLIAWAQSVDGDQADRLVERLFKAYFAEGVDIGGVEELARLAGEAGYDADAARAHLASDAGRTEVQAADERTRAMGIGGVPFFIFNRRVAVSGAQPSDVLLEAMSQAAGT
jgi:predicted DsbA family dithiol-disulfide isomerase